jgi:hypothetical protein
MLDRRGVTGRALCFSLPVTRVAPVAGTASKPDSSHVMSIELAYNSSVPRVTASPRTIGITALVCHKQHRARPPVVTHDSSLLRATSGLGLLSGVQVARTAKRVVPTRGGGLDTVEPKRAARYSLITGTTARGSPPRFPSYPVLQAHVGERPRCARAGASARQRAVCLVDSTRHSRPRRSQSRQPHSR